MPFILFEVTYFMYMCVICTYCSTYSVVFISSQQRRSW